ncbi:MAG TPA: hypothetical protein VLO07_00895 [Thermoanaerobaculia bacterium]|nr:hypothetical protein [Thermoanaerobaculia bacterium]
MRDSVMRLTPLLWLAGWTLCCSATAGLKPVLDRDPGVSCPGGQTAWNLQIADQRAERGDSDRLVALLRDSLARSLPGCRWTAQDPSAPTIRIEIYRFAADLDGSLWEAAAEWSVRAEDASGHTMTEFQSTAEVARPNYRDSNNERVALQEAFEQALRRTLAGLRAVSLPG